MKKYINIIVVMALALVSFSCAKGLNTENGTEEPDAVKMVDVNLEVSTEENSNPSDGTKVSVDGTTTSWELGDSVAVFVRPPQGQSAYPAYKFRVSSIGNNGKTAVLSGKIPEGAGPFVSAVYPYDKNATGGWGGKIQSYTIPTTQNGKFSNIVFWGKPKDVPGGATITENNKHYTFSASSGIIKITIPEGLSVRAIVLTSNNNLAGTVEINEQGTFGYPANPSNKITVLAEEGETLSGDIYVTVLPTSVNNSISMDIVNTDLKYVSFSKSGMKPFKKGTIEKFGTLPATTKFPYDARAISVSASKKVVFSPGLLQYQPSNKVWKFAQDQLTIIGDNPGNNTYANSKLDENNRKEMTDWIDLFPYGHSCDEYPPYECLNVNAYYFSHIKGAQSLVGDTYGKYDWGANKILNGDDEDEPYTWRLLTSSEYNYITGIGGITGRSDKVSDRFCRVVIDETICGTLLFPDLFIWPATAQRPATASFAYYPINHQYGKWEKGWAWYITMEQFNALQSMGAVFLINPGFRPGPVDDEGRFEIRFKDNMENMPVAHYWSSTGLGAIWISSGNMGANDQSVGSVARAVRLVKDVPTAN